jgi:hypothetical protein
MSDIPDEEIAQHDYLVTESREVLVRASSAAEARKTAEAIFQLAPASKAITKSVNVEKVRN